MDTTLCLLNNRLKQETDVSKEHFAKEQSNTGGKLNAFGNVSADLFDSQCQIQFGSLHLNLPISLISEKPVKVMFYDIRDVFRGLSVVIHIPETTTPSGTITSAHVVKVHNFAAAEQNSMGKAA